MERIDDSIRVMLYGHGKRGTDGPIMTFDKGDGSDYWDYFNGQLEWAQRLADADPIPEPWRSKGVRVWQYDG
jgi:hypothetical protein